jgi:GNAT superfamily N-acetyltransferase
MSDFSIRAASAADAPVIMALLRELADYEKLLEEFHPTEALIARDMLGPDAACRCDIAWKGDEPAGIVVWYWIYRSFRARRGLYLEDLFVRPGFRGQGLGRLLLRHLAATAVTAGADFMDWKVLDWNTPSIDFYRSLGAVQIPGWLDYRLEGDALERLAS